jgi:hypothetical protein
MTDPWRNRKALLLTVLVLACTAVAVSIGVVYPTPVASPALGADWKCHRAVGIVTTCHRVVHAAPMSHRPQTQVPDTLRV